MQNCSPHDTLGRPTHVNDLLEMRGTRFIHATYNALLGREPDTGGLSHYSQQLLRKNDKRAIIADIALSAEGKNRNQTLPGLEALLLHQRNRQGPVYTLLRRLLPSSAIKATIDRALEQLAMDLEIFHTDLKHQLARNSAHLDFVLQEILQVSRPETPRRIESSADRPVIDAPAHTSFAENYPVLERTLDGSGTPHDFLARLAKHLNMSREAAIIADSMAREKQPKRYET